MKAFLWYQIYTYYDEPIFFTFLCVTQQKCVLTLQMCVRNISTKMPHCSEVFVYAELVTSSNLEI